MLYQYFITATGTNCGKTTVSALLLNRARSLGLQCVGIKPISSGCYGPTHNLTSPDADLLRASSNVALSYDQSAPWRFAPAIAPHLAAQQVGATLHCANVCQHITAVGAMAGLQCMLVEGAGGWHVPLNAQQLYSQVPSELALPVIMVVDIKLGCLNMALLTAEAIGRSNTHLAGWVANITNPTQDHTLLQAQIDYLSAALAAPLCGIVPYLSDLPAYANNLSGHAHTLKLPFEFNAH